MYKDLGDQLIKRLEEEQCVRDPNNLLKYILPLEKCTHPSYSVEKDNHRWICYKCMTLFGSDPNE